MKERVSELSMEEFKKTFPIILKEHNESYKEWYESEKQSIVNAAGAENVARINHIGSTAVEGLIAKPTVDILLEIDGCCHLTKLIENLKAIGYGEEIFTRNDDPMRLLLGKGYSTRGYAQRVYHLHVRYFGDWDELYFRDFLLEKPEVLAEYGDLKRKILKDIENGSIERLPNGTPNGYSAAKLVFVQECSRAAKQEFPNRYKPR